MLINGIHTNTINATDRGFQYGDGLFETIEVLNGQLVFQEPHWQRLNLGCQKLLIPPPEKQLLNDAQNLITNCQHGVLKIIITRGSGGRGYQFPQTMQPTQVLSLHPYPEYPYDFQSIGIRARFCQHRLGLNPALAGLKHLNRLEQILARAEWNDSAIQEGLLFDLNGFVIEGTMSNLFFVKQQQLFTPILTQAGVAGIMRDFIIQTAKQFEIPLFCEFYTAEQLLAADEIFICNSIIGIWPIVQLEDHSFAIGKITQKLQTYLANYKAQFTHLA